MTDAMPTPTPPSSRHRISVHTLPASPDPSALTARRSAASCIVRTRPARSATGPAYHAPSAEPSNAQDTANPVQTALRPKPERTASTAPLITAVSNPNKKPPIAAALAIRITRAVAAGGRGTLANVSLLIARAPVDGSILLRGGRGDGLNTYSQIRGARRTAEW